MATVAELLAEADTRAKIEVLAKVFVDVAFPQAMIERYVDECFRAKGDLTLIEAATLRLREQVDGLYRQLVPTADALPADQRDKLIDTLMSAVMKRAKEIAPDRVPPGGGGRRVAA